ncbi:MAG TPA: hypothetical protein VKE49_09815, partial [Myxococcaceae bacterium]|nr:hypothetical protein [Myxococcaceae bacterium]
MPMCWRSGRAKWSAWASLVAIPFAALAQTSGIPTKPAPGIDWQNQVVRATGSGAPDVNAANPSQAR